ELWSLSDSPWTKMGGKHLNTKSSPLLNLVTSFFMLIFLRNDKHILVLTQYVGVIYYEILAIQSTTVLKIAPQLIRFGKKEDKQFSIVGWQICEFHSTNLAFIKNIFLLILTIDFRILKSGLCMMIQCLYMMIQVLVGKMRGLPHISILSLEFEIERKKKIKIKTQDRPQSCRTQ
ncbi:hypothetical protein ACJX0J_040748, partial [Zea mays]